MPPLPALPPLPVVPVVLLPLEEVPALLAVPLFAESEALTNGESGPVELPDEPHAVTDNSNAMSKRYVGNRAFISPCSMATGVSETPGRRLFRLLQSDTTAALVYSPYQYVVAEARCAALLT